MPSSVVGSNRTIDSRRSRSGQRIAVMTAPSAVSLKMPLRKLAPACLPKIRLSPAPGEIFSNFGFICSLDHTRRCCSMLPAIAASASINSGTPIAPSTTKQRWRASSSSPGPSVWIIQELAIRLRSGSSRPPIDPEKVDMISVLPAITNQVLTSWLLTTSPRSSASSRRFCVGSSVFSESSSAMTQRLRNSLERHHLVHHADEVIEESAHHRHDHEREDQEAGEDR